MYCPSSDGSIKVAVRTLVDSFNTILEEEITSTSRCLERDIMKELISKVFKYLASSIVIETKFRSFFNEELETEKVITCGNLGIGNNLRTWYGSPDARIRGSSSSFSEVVLTTDFPRVIPLPLQMVLLLSRN